MIAAKHFFAYLPSSETDPAWKAQLNAAFRRLGYRILERSYPLGIVSFADQPEPQPAETAILHVTPGTETGIRSRLATLKDSQSANDFAFDTVRLFNLLTGDHDSLTIFSDRLLLLPYYTAKLDRGILVCSSIRHMFAACPDLSQQGDQQAIFEFLCCGIPFGPRTLHQAVRLASPGQLIHWDRSKGLGIDRTARTPMPPANAALAAPAAVNEIAGHIKESLGKLPPPGLLPLTGGFDSRLIACFAASLKLHPRMLTLGYPKHDEIRVARAVAETLGSTTTVFPPPHPDVLELVPIWLDTLEGLADAHTLFMANLLSFPESEGTPFYHGFIGDTLSGALLNWIPIETAREPREIAKGASVHFFREISPQAGETLQLSASIDKSIDDIEAEMVPGVAPHQTFTLWNLENIQRRLVGHQLLYIGRRFMPSPVFYYRPLMDFWLSVPRMALDNRTLLRYVFQTQFPKIATLAHAEHEPSLIPRSMPSLKYLSGWLSRRYGARILRKLKLDADKMEGSSYIWRLWHGTTPEQRKHELQRLDETLGLLQSRLGWNAPQPVDALWAKCTALERKQVLLLRRLYLLGEYAKSLPEPAAQPSPLTYDVIAQK